MNQGLTQEIELPADRALFEGSVQGMVITCHQNERPLAGLAGLLDWRFQGALTRGLKAGSFTGKPGECVYFPIRRHATTFHLILAGAGHSSAPGKRAEVPAETLKLLKKNLKSLKLNRMGVSRSDFGARSVAALLKEEALVWVTP